MDAPRPPPQSIESNYRPDFLPRNHEPMDPYFGEFLGLLRRALNSGGSEFGLGLTLFSLATSIKATTIIEIGRFRGFSTLALASALRLLDVGWDEPQQHKQRTDIDYASFEAPRKRLLLSVDPFPTPEADQLIAAANLTSYVQMINARSEQVKIQVSADLIFIDGDHTYEGCRGDCMRLIPNNLRHGGYFVVHDYYGWYDDKGRNRSPIKRVADEIVALGQMQHLLIDTGYMSLVVFRKP